MGEEKESKRKSKRERVAVKSNESKENPTHFKEVDGGRVVFKAHGLRSMGLFFLLAHEYTAGVGWITAVE